jgi:hypothetical protein
MDFRPAHLGQHDVEQGNVNTIVEALEFPQRLFAVGRKHHSVTQARQNLESNLPETIVILRHEDRFVAASDDAPIIGWSVRNH